MSGARARGVPLDDEREVLATGTQAISSQVTKQPILGSYLPVNAVQRYTFKKWDHADWNRNNETKKFQSMTDREASRNIREEARELINSTTERASRTQTDVTEKLGERVQDVSYWKFELERTIQDMINENDLLRDEIRRIENALKSTQEPNHIAQDCLSNRQRRVDSDLVQDDAEKQLLKEMEVISSVRETLTRALENAKDQLASNKEMKHQLEKDWSDKFSAHHLDSRSVSLKNSRGNVTYKDGAASYKETESDPTVWIGHSQFNIRRANDEREASVRLRAMNASTLSRVSQDMREQADRVEEALSRRVAETEEASRQLEIELKETVDEITQLEATIESLNEAHWERQKPLKVAQTRLGNRHQRPNVEKCRDEPAHRLVEEVSELEESLRKIEFKTEQSEDKLRDLQHTRMSLMKEIEIKRNSLIIDRDRCLKTRGMFPSTNLLCGYRNRTAL